MALDPMPGRPVTPKVLRAEILRDLLGMTRALYRERREAGAAPETMELIGRAGEAFKLALQFSALQPDTIGHRAGWGWADKGIALLVEVLSEGDVKASELLRHTVLVMVKPVQSC